MTLDGCDPLLVRSAARQKAEAGADPRGLVARVVGSRMRAKLGDGWARGLVLCEALTWTCADKRTAGEVES